MRTGLVALLLVVGCSSGAPPAPPVATPPATPTAVPAVPTPETAPGSGGGSGNCEAPRAGEAMTEVQCTCQGGRVNASKGGGDQPHCDPNEDDVGSVRFGIEGGWCCKAAAAAR